MNVLVIGGTGFIGPHVATGLCRLGHAVTVFHRGETEAELPAEVRHLHCPPSVRFADRSHFRDFLDDFRRLAPDVVIDMIPATVTDALIATTAFRGLAGRMVAISSQDVYRAYGGLTGSEDAPIDPTPLSEDAPLRKRLFPYRGESPRPSDDPRSWMDDYDKIEVERVVLGDPELPGTILRLPMVYGPRDRQHRVREHLQPMDEGKTSIPLPAALARWRWTRGYVEDIAAAIVLAATSPRATGRIYNVGESEALTMRDWVEAIGRAAGWTGKVASVPEDLLPPQMRTSMHVEHDIVTDSARIRSELGYRESVSGEDALARTIAWEREVRGA